MNLQHTILAIVFIHILYLTKTNYSLSLILFKNKEELDITEEIKEKWHLADFIKIFN